MSILHAVWLLPKPETTNEEIQVVLEKVETLQQKIPGIIDIQTGKNLNPNNAGYTYGFTIRFVDEEHLKGYFPHPAHKEVSPELRRLCSNLLNFDLSEDK